MPTSRLPHRDAGAVVVPRGGNLPNAERAVAPGSEGPAASRLPPRVTVAPDAAGTYALDATVPDRSGPTKVLTALIPGLREIRAPLAAGYLWLFLLWLVWGDSVPSRDEAEGALGRVYDLEPLYKSIGVVAVLSVLAYIVGSLANVAASFAARAALNLIEKFRRRLPSYRRTHKSGVKPWMSRFELNLLLSDVGKTELREWAWRRMIKEYLGFWAPPGTRSELEVAAFSARLVRNVPQEIDDLGMFLVNRVVEDLEVLKRRLLVADPTLFNQVDRLESEGAFRLALATPLAALSLWLAATESAVYAVALLVVAAVVSHGWALQRQGRDFLVSALRARHELEPDVLDDVRRDLAEWMQGSGATSVEAHQDAMHVDTQS